MPDPLSLGRRLLGLTFALAIVALPLAAAPRIAGVEVPPPPAARPVTDTYFGEQVVDPYRFLEDVKASDVAGWMKGQASATEAILARIPGRAELIERIRAIESRAAGSAGSAQRSVDGRLFYLRRDPADNQFRLVWRETLDGADRVIIDPQQLTRATGRTHALMDFEPSPDGQLVAYSVQAGGGEIGTLHVVEVASGKPVIEPVDRIRYAGVNWLDDSSGFFFSRLREGYETLPATERLGDTTVQFVPLGGERTARVVFSASRAPALGLPTHAAGSISQLPGTSRALNVVRLGVDRNLLVYAAELADVIAGKADWQRIAGADDRVASVQATHRGDLYLRSSAGAPRYKVLKLAAGEQDLARARTVVPASDGVVTGIAATRDALYVVRRDGATQSLLRLDHAPDARLQPVALPFEGSVSITGATPQRSDLLLLLGGWTHTTKPWLLDAGGLRQLPLVEPGAYDSPTDIVAREVRFRSHDGVEVPLSILSRRDAKHDGKAPTIVYGYGAYGTTDNPFFNPRIHAWLERGGIYAIAHVRGGGAFGEEWHHAGRQATKPNTWKDAIAATEWLIANGYTNAARVGIFGGSAGGILVGRAITERPDLFAAAVPSVGVMDMLRSELRPNGVANVPEYGSVNTEAGYRALRAMSTYAHIEPGVKYPGLMFVHGVNDIRVPVSESLKAAARFGAASASDKPVLLRLDYDSGHGQGSSRQQQQERSADIWAFFLWQFGEPAFQPRPTAASAADPQATRTLHALFDRSWQRVAARYPEWGTYRGDHRYNDRLDDVSPAAQALDDEQQRTELAAARAIDPTLLGATDRISQALFIDDTERRLALARFEGHRLRQIDALDGVQSELASLLQAVPMDSTLRAEQLLTRLRAYPAKLDQQIVNLKRGASLGWTPSRPVLERALVQIDGQLPEVSTSSPFLAPFQQLPAAMPTAERERLQRAGREAVETHVIPAMRRLRSFIAGEYMAAAPADGAMLHYPGGREVYDELVRQHTTTRLSAAEVHALGQREMTRLRAEMETVMRSTGFAGDFAAFITFLNTDPKFFHASPQALLAGYRDIAKRLDAEIPKLFAELPRVPYGIRAMPDHMSPDRAEYYDGPPDDGSRPGWFNANARGYRTRPIWGMATLTAHETVPGHHLQVARAQELKQLPEFRRHAHYTAFVEGWALYAETLARELGIYDDPYSLLGHLQAQSMRAARLVVDTGIHSLGWSRLQAIEYMTERTGLDHGFVESEVDRYTSVPAQALAYTVGQLKFAELRQRAQHELGPRFDLRRFHNALIDNGALPLSTLEQLVGEWIEGERVR